MTLTQQLEKLNKELKATNNKMKVINKKLEHVATFIGVDLPVDRIVNTQEKEQHIKGVKND